MSRITNTSNSESHDASRYFDAIRHHWRLIVVLLVAGIAGSAAYTLVTPAKYKAEADVVVTPVTDNTYDGIEGLFRDSATSVYTAGRLVQTPPIVAGARRILGTDTSAKALLKSIKVTPLQQSNTVAIVATASSPSRAANVANAFARALLLNRTAAFRSRLAASIKRLHDGLLTAQGRAQQQALQNLLAQRQALVGADDPTLQIASRATRPETAAVKPKLGIVIALLASLILGVALALILEFLHPKVSSESELERRVPILSRIPRLRQKTVRSYLAGADSLPGVAWEAYRTLRANLLAGNADRRVPQSILVTSGIKGEGKTMTSVNLAIALASGGFRVVLVEADLRRPAVAKAFGIDSAVGGLGLLLSGRTSIDETLTPAPGFDGRLQLLLAGTEGNRSVDLLQPRHVVEALDRLRAETDVIVVDSPPLTEFADALSLADAAEVVLVAVRLGRSRRDRLHELETMLDQNGIKPDGLVVTSRRRSRARDRVPATAEASSTNGKLRTARVGPAVAATYGRDG
jgi:capsular exopolysaccharide synthesis family protein